MTRAKIDHRTKVRELYKKAGILPAKPLAGCPALPTPTVTCDSWINKAEYIAAAEAAHAEGYGLAAVLAFRYCAMFSPGDPLPSWIMRALANGFGAWLDGYADNIEEGLGASRGNVKDRPETLAARDFAGQMYLDARREIEAGAKVDAALWERIGERYGLSARTAERAVRGLGVSLPTAKRQKRHAF